MKNPYFAKLKESIVKTMDSFNLNISRKLLFTEQLTKLILFKDTLNLTNITSFSQSKHE